MSSRQVFEKDGLSRALCVDGDYLYCKDFYMFYVIDRQSSETIRSLKLGDDLSSDICGITSDNKNIYACIRNGPLVVIPKGDMENVSYHQVSSSSIWEIVASDYLYARNVEGNLLVIDRNKFNVVRALDIHKQNLRSIYVDENVIISAAQDKSLVITDKKFLRVK